MAMFVVTLGDIVSLSLFAIGVFVFAVWFLYQVAADVIRSFKQKKGGK